MFTPAQPRPHGDPLLIGIACSVWTQPQRRALVLVAMGRADHIEHFVPHLWNRIAKARAAVREMELAGHLVRDPGGRLFLIETSFAEPELGTPMQLALPEEPLLGAALAAISRVDKNHQPTDPTEPTTEKNRVNETHPSKGEGRLGDGGNVPRGQDEGCPVPDGTRRPSQDKGCPVQDRTGCPSWDGRAPPESCASVCAPSVPGRTPPENERVKAPNSAPEAFPLPHTPSSLERLNAERLTVNMLTGQRSASSALLREKEKENELLRRITGLVGPEDMEYWGGDWRKNWLRKFPAAKIESALAECENAQREGRVQPRVCWGAYLKYLIRTFTNWDRTTSGPAKGGARTTNQRGC